LAAITHPDYASLVDSLFAARKEGNFFFYFIHNPLSAEGEERVVERSNDRVSYRRLIKAQVMHRRLS
jgi:hypothetical protein